MTFSSREEAGQELGERLVVKGVQTDLVLGLPRGGVVVASEVARHLGRSLDVLVVRKIGHPRHREYAVGALAEPDVVLLDQEALSNSRVDRRELERVIAEEKERLHSYQAVFHPSGPPQLNGLSVAIVDDGIATGATAEAAVASARERHAAKVIIAVPVASTGAVRRLSRVADQVIALLTDPGFMAVGQYYDSFPQTSDAQVLALLPAHA